MKKLKEPIRPTARRPTIPFRRVFQPGKSPQDGLSRKDRERLEKERATTEDERGGDLP